MGRRLSKVNPSPDAELNLAMLLDRQLGLDALLENMAEGFAMCEAVWDAQGRLCDYTILEMNAALQRMLGVGPEAIGSKLSDSSGDRVDWLKLCDRVLKTGAPSSFEVHTRGLDLWHEIRVTQVTEAKMAQNLLRRHRAKASGTPPGGPVR